MNDVHTGRCLCGDVRFSARGPLRGVIYCHCTQCRRQTGHHYAATNVGDNDITIEGRESLTWFRASEGARRGFCSTCGSALFWKRDNSDDISVMAGAFDAPTGLSGEAHIFVEHKGDYYELSDGLPQYRRSTPSVKVASD